MADRRTEILDAALRVLAEHGMRGLTHRGVDAAAGIAPGSTSYYFRSRSALVEGCVARLVEIDQAAPEVVAVRARGGRRRDPRVRRPHARRGGRRRPRRRGRRERRPAGRAGLHGARPRPPRPRRPRRLGASPAGARPAQLDRPPSAESPFSRRRVPVFVTASPRFRDAEVGGHPATAGEVRGPSTRAGRGGRGVAAAVAIQRAGSARPR